MLPPFYLTKSILTEAPTVVAGTYAVTLQARLVSGSTSEVHHVDLVAMGNLQ